jgi:hypothetical protein
VPRPPVSSPAVAGDVENLDSVSAGHLEPLGHEVDADHPRAPVCRDARAHLPDRTEPEDGHASPLRDLGVLDRLPGRRQHVGQVEEALVGWSLGHLDRAELRLRDAQELGLAARHLAVQLRVAEQGRAGVPLADLGRLALGEELVLAHPAVSAGDVEGDHDAVPGCDVGHLRAHLNDDAHRLVPEHVALVEKRPEQLVEVQV